jgi:phosphatidylglycerophosphate synthase
MNVNPEQQDKSDSPPSDRSNFFSCGQLRQLASTPLAEQHPAAPTIGKVSFEVQKTPLQPDRTPDANRRPMKTRSSKWAQILARAVSRLGVTANHVSLASIGVAVLGGALLLSSASGDHRVWVVLLAAACIQLRLLANMLDGLIAVEGGRKTPPGELYNEIPDRVADVVLLVSAGYASQHGSVGAALGWCAAVLAVGTAYLRALGARRGHPQDFSGPLAKPQRMFLLTLACLFGAAESFVGLSPNALFFALILLNVGTLWTCIQRTRRLGAQLRDTAASL